MDKKAVDFSIMYFQGVTCGGCSVVDELDLKVEFTEDEVAQMRQLVSQLDEECYCEGILPVLEEAAPTLHQRIREAARKRIFDFLVRQGISLDYIEFKEDELLANYRKDLGIGKGKAIDKDSYYEWYDEEMERIRNNDLQWVRSRYSVDDSVELEDDEELDYTVDIPVEFINMSA